MATNTTNYGLRKPDAVDVINVDADLNNNYDTIDTQLKSNADVSAQALAAANDQNIIQAQATDVALPADVWTEIIATLQNQNPLPVGEVVFDLWFAVSAPIAPTSLQIRTSSGLVRDWIIQSWSQGDGGAESATNTTIDTTVLPVAPGTTPTLYQVKGFVNEINPSSYVKIELMSQGQAATLHNFVCVSTVNSLGEL